MSNEYYPCPVCFTKGRARAGVVIEKGLIAVMWIREETKQEKELQYDCPCGAVLLVPKEA